MPYFRPAQPQVIVERPVRRARPAPSEMEEAFVETFVIVRQDDEIRD
jgi:hypothetical protein